MPTISLNTFKHNPSCAGGIPLSNENAAPDEPVSNYTYQTMKVVVIIDSLLPGGAESSLLNLLPGLRAHGIEPMLVCLKRWTHETLEEEARSKGIEPHFLSERSAPSKWYFKLPLWAWKLRQLVSREHPALIHSTLFQAGMTCRFGLIGTGVPLLSSLVNLDYSPERELDPNIRGGKLLTSLKLLALRDLNRYTAFLVTHFHAVTPAVKREAIRHLSLPPEKISVVFRGRESSRPVDNQRRQSIRARLKVGDGTKLLLNLGRQEYQKGQIYIIRALAQGELRNRDIKLLIAGRSGCVTDQLKNEVQALNLENRVEFLGHRTDVPDLLAASDAFVLPSLFEGAAGALLEAMAAAKPIVTTDLPELQGIIDDRSAVKVPTRSAPNLSRAIAYLLDNPEKAESLAVEAKKTFEKNFLLDEITCKMADLYKSLGSGAPPKAK